LCPRGLAPDAILRLKLSLALISPRVQPAPAPFLALVRHARAEKARPGQVDSERALTPEGRASFADQVRRLESIAFQCDHLWSSPWRRARETAEMLRGTSRSQVAEHPGLCSEQDSRAGLELRELAARTAQGARLVLVGHAPWLVELASRLGATDITDIDCGEIVWLTPRSGRSWGVAARLIPN
jgi:phosphohistidine phosphatase SixA